MPIKIRLRRMGRKKQPHYRVVVADIDSPRDGRFIETLGYYKPLTHPARLVLDLDRVDYWVGEGAQTSDTVANLVKKARKGGDPSLAIGEVDQDAEKLGRLEALATRRRAEAEASAKEAEEAKAAKAPAKKADPEPEAEATPEAEVVEETPKAEAAEEAPEAEAVEEAPKAEAAEEAPEAEVVEEAPEAEAAEEAEAASEAPAEEPAEEKKSK
jgi:small subunit ribosomal protein S16